MATIDRSTINSEQYAAPEFSKSGFDLSYKRYSSFALGRIHVGGIQYVMPGDKISGSSSFNGTFNSIVTPLITPVRAMSYQIFLPFRAVDTSFMKGMTPTKLNAMSSNWSVPTITTRQLVRDIFASIYGWTSTTSIDPSSDNYDYNLYILINLLLATGGTNTIADFLSDDENITREQFEDFLTKVIVAFTNPQPVASVFRAMADKLYLSDALLDIYNNFAVKLGIVDSQTSSFDTSMQIKDFLNLYLDAVLTPFVGRYSYYGECKYNYVRPWDIYRLSHGVGISNQLSGFNDFLNLFDATPQSEYALRIMYAIWYERFRNVDLEPVSNDLPDWREFGSTSIFDLNNGGNLFYLIWRIRSWEKDMFTTAQIDDISRHVYAPIVSQSGAVVSYRDDVYNGSDTQFQSDSDFSESTDAGVSKKPSVYKIGYLNQLDGINSYVSVPVPSNVNDVLADIDKEFVDVFGLDLNTLRQSQMLERYLKRNYLFGDEYQDRLLAHYNTRLSDMRINRPEIVGQSIGDYDMGQQVANVSTAESNVGDRTATATVTLSGDGYSTYIEEFGLIITLYCFMPRPMYDGILPQHLSTKQVDFPLPEFAANNEEFGRKMEIASSGLNLATDNEQDIRYMFGRYPAYHAWRSRVDEVGGMFLDELQDATFRRFWGMFDVNSIPKLNYMFLHCRPNLAMFANTNLYDTQIYGDIVNECLVERVLPTPVETI